MRQRIVYTRHDGGVSICCPTDWTISAMCNGGAWPSLPWYYPGFDKVQIERMVARGIREDDAVRYAIAMMAGGCTNAEALEIIRDRDCAPHGTAIELWDVSEIPTDRWFRPAWRRSHNGGPISVDLKLARPIHWKRARKAAEKQNKRRADEFEIMPQIEVDWDRIRERIRGAIDETDLRQIWPEGLGGAPLAHPTV